MAEREKYLEKEGERRSLSDKVVSKRPKVDLFIKEKPVIKIFKATIMTTEGSRNKFFV